MLLFTRTFDDAFLVKRPWKVLFEEHIHHVAFHL